MRPEVSGQKRGWVFLPRRFGLPNRAEFTFMTPALLFGIRLWAAVCLALFISFELELDDSLWAGMSAAVVCQPRLGAGLRKGYFRMIGTVVGAIAVLVLSGLFPQQRLWFLLGLALWGGACGFASRLLRNFASYSAALAGYTAAVIAAGELGTTGGCDGAAFHFAIIRTSEICIGIVSASVVMAGTDLGGARHRLAHQLAELSQKISTHFVNTLMLDGPGETAERDIRRELTRRVIALDATVDEVQGENSDLRPHSKSFECATNGLLATLSAWRTVARHLEVMPEEQQKHEAELIRAVIPQRMALAVQPSAAHFWHTDPAALRQDCLTGAAALAAFPAATASQRLLADWTAEALLGQEHVLNGLTLLVAPLQAVPRRGHSGWHIPDCLPALVSALRVFVTFVVIAFLWVLTAWPNGMQAVVFGTIAVLLFSPRGVAATDSFAVGACCAALGAGIADFAILPYLSTFFGFSLVLALFLVPAGFCVARLRNTSLFAGMILTFLPLLAPTNEMNYDATVFFNSAVGIVVGTVIAAIICRVMPAVPPAARARRLLTFTLRDLRRLALRPGPSPAAWEGRVFQNLYVLPDQAQPQQRAQLLAALAVGKEIIRLRRVAHGLGLQAELRIALATFAAGKAARAIDCLAEIDRRVGAMAAEHPQAGQMLKARASLLAIREALTQHAAYFVSGAGR
jgi:uncharacterized membrane protein YccC